MTPALHATKENTNQLLDNLPAKHVRLDLLVRVLECREPMRVETEHIKAALDNSRAYLVLQVCTLNELLYFIIYLFYQISIAPNSNKNQL
jgi:hypothetical protein